MQEILRHTFSGQGLGRVYDNGEWMVGIKNYKPANDVEGIDCVERHNETDELFVLLDGECILLYANELMSSSAEMGLPSGAATAPVLELRALSMEPGSVYTVPKGLWHNTVTRPDTKLILVEAAATGAHNSDVLRLTDGQRMAVKGLVSARRQRT